MVEEFGRSFATLPMGQLICGPIIAVAQGQSELCRVYLDYLFELAFREGDPEKGLPGGEKSSSSFSSSSTAAAAHSLMRTLSRPTALWWARVTKGTATRAPSSPPVDGGNRIEVVLGV